MVSVTGSVTGVVLVAATRRGRRIASGAPHSLCSVCGRDQPPGVVGTTILPLMMSAFSFSRVPAYWLMAEFEMA